MFFKHTPFKGLFYSCNTYSAFCSVLVEQHPAIPGTLTDVHSTGGYLVHPHHLPHTLGFQEPAGALLQDPNSRISFNSPLNAESPGRQKYFFPYLFWMCCHDSIFIFLWRKQKAPYVWVVQDVSYTLKQPTESTTPLHTRTSSSTALASMSLLTAIHYRFAFELSIESKRCFVFSKELLMRLTPIRSIKQVFTILRKLLSCNAKEKSYTLTSTSLNEISWVLPYIWLVTFLFLSCR